MSKHPTNEELAAHLTGIACLADDAERALHTGCTHLHFLEHITRIEHICQNIRTAVADHRASLSKRTVK